VYQLEGPEWLTEQQTRSIFDASRWQLTHWQTGRPLRRREVFPGVFEYRRTDVEQLANTPGKPGTLARKQLAHRSPASSSISAPQRRG
jgi:hypothetical protein